MESNEAIICPNCRELQDDSILDLLDVGDMEGEFEMHCIECTEPFRVKFMFLPIVRTYPEGEAV